MIVVLNILLTILSVVSVYIGEVMLVKSIYKTDLAISAADFTGAKNAPISSSGASKIRAILRLLSTVITAVLFYMLTSLFAFSPAAVAPENATNGTGEGVSEGVTGGNFFETSQNISLWKLAVVVIAVLVVAGLLWFIGKGTLTDGIFHCCALFTSLIIYAEFCSFLNGFIGLVSSVIFPFVARFASGLAPVIVFIPLIRASSSEDQESWHKETALLVTAINFFVHLTAIGIGMVILIRENNYGIYLMAFIMFSAAVVNTLIVCLGVILAKDRYYKRVTHINNEMLSAQASHYEAVKQSNFEIRRVKHDMKNHLLVIEELAKTQNYEELLKYTAELNQQISSADVFYRTGNDIADAILSDKNNKASLRGITLKVSGDLYGCALNPADLCTVIGNLLDNAIEAVGGFYGLDTDEETRTVFFEMRKNDNFMLITESNYSPTPIVRKDNKIISSKNSDNHGFGIYNIKNVVAKYDGDFAIIPEKITDPARASYYKYRFEIMLPMK